MPSAAIRASAVAGAGQTATVTTLTFAVPADSVVGDVAIVSLEAGSGSGQFTTPTGWTLLSGPTRISTSATSQLFSRTLTAEDLGTSVSFVYSDARRMSGVMVVVSDVKTDGIVVGVQVDSASTTSAALPTVGNVPVGAALIAFANRRAGVIASPNVTWPAEYTAVAEAATAYTSLPQLNVEAGYRVVTVAGDYNGTATVDRASLGAQYLVALAPSTVYTPPVNVVTLFGYNTNDTDSPLSERLAWWNNRAPVVRRYTGAMLPATFNVSLAQAPEKRLSYSFKFEGSGDFTPAGLAAGSGNARIKSWVESIPEGWTVYLTYMHEVNDDIREGRITSAQFTGAYDQFYPVIKSASLKPGVTVKLAANFMSYMMTDPAYFSDSWVPGHNSMDLLTFDIYGNPGHFTTQVTGPALGTSYPNPQTRAADMFAVIDRLGWGEHWGILEYNTPKRDWDTDEQARTDWLVQMTEMFLARPAKPEICLIWEAPSGVNWNQAFVTQKPVDALRTYIVGTPVGGSGVAPVKTADPTNLYRAPQQVDSLVAANPELAAIRDVPQAVWVTEGTSQATVQGWVTAAAGKTIPMSVYAIPGRDNGQYSAGGFADRAAYLNFLTTVVKGGLGNAPAIIAYEADALGLSRNLDATTKAERLETMRQAIDILATIPNAEVYVDASGWVPPVEQADLLRQIDVTRIEGFVNNVSGYESEATVLAYGNSVIAELNNLGITGKKFVMDTSRNGAGPLTADFPGSQPWFSAGQTWCNPPGRRLGRLPGLVSDQPNVRAALWIKNPGESDGNSPQLNSGVPNTFVSSYYGASAPNAGVFWLPLARDLLGLTPTPGSTSPTGTAHFGTLSTNFNTDMGPFTAGSSGPTIVDGRLRIPVGVGMYENRVTPASYTLKGGVTAARVYPPTANGAAYAEVLMEIKSATEGTRLVVIVGTGTSGGLTLGSQSGYWDPNAVVLPYDPVAHAYVRMRESAGTVYWDTSSDGVTWVNRRTLATPAWVNNDTTQALQFTGNRDTGATNYAEVDNFNISAAAPIAFTGTLALSSVGNVNLIGRATLRAALALSGAGISAFSSRLITRGAFAADGNGALNLIGRPSSSGSVALTGISSLVTTARLTLKDTLSAAGAGSLSFTGRPMFRNAVTAAGSGTLSLFGTAEGANARGGPVTLTSTGTLTLAGRTAVRGTITLGSVGALTYASAVSISGNITLTNFGVLALAGEMRPHYVGNLVGVGVGTLIVTGRATAAARWRFRALAEIVFGEGSGFALGYVEGDVVPDIVVDLYPLIAQRLVERRND